MVINLLRSLGLEIPFRKCQSARRSCPIFRLLFEPEYKKKCIRKLQKLLSEKKGKEKQ